MSLSRNSNMDVLITSAAHVLIDDAAEYMRSIDTSNTVISKSLDRRVHRSIRKYSKKSWWSSVPVACKKVVAAIMMFCTISFAMSMSVEAVREEVWNTILEWYDKFVAVFYVTDETPPSVIEEYREPTLQLAGTEQIVIAQADTLYQIHYMVDDSLVMIYQQMILTDQSKDLDVENGCIQEIIKIDEYQCQLLSYVDGRKTLTWHDNEYTYVIYSYLGNIDTKSLTIIAESIN